MPSGSIAVIAFLALGYALFVVELVVPGGILGILGLLSVAYGCYIAFDLGPAWGAGSILASLGAFGGALYFMLKSKTGRHLTFQDNEEERRWKSADQSLPALLGTRGVAASALRPAGVALFGERRVDVVSDNEFLPVGSVLEVVEVEGSRVVVEAVPPTLDVETAADDFIESAAEKPPAAVASTPAGDFRPEDLRPEDLRPEDLRPDRQA